MTLQLVYLDDFKGPANAQLNGQFPRFTLDPTNFYGRSYPAASNIAGLFTDGLGNLKYTPATSNSQSLLQIFPTSASITKVRLDVTFTYDGSAPGATNGINVGVTGLSGGGSPYVYMKLYTNGLNSLPFNYDVRAIDYNPGIVLGGGTYRATMDVDLLAGTVVFYIVNQTTGQIYTFTNAVGAFGAGNGNANVYLQHALTEVSGITRITLQRYAIFAEYTGYNPPSLFPNARQINLRNFTMPINPFGF